MTISLTNRVMIAIGISNFGAEKYWRRIYEERDIFIGPRNYYITLVSRSLAVLSQEIQRDNGSKK